MDTATAIVDLLSVALMVRNTIYSCIMNETVDADCTEGAIRLVNGPTKSEGTLEICHNKLWGLIQMTTIGEVRELV